MQRVFIQQIVLRLCHLDPNLQLSRSTLVRKTFYGISLANNVHQGHTGYLPDPSPQVSITSRDYVYLICHDALNKTIVGVSPRMRAREPFKPGVPSNSVRLTVSPLFLLKWFLADVPKSKTVFWAELLQFSYDTVCDTWYTCKILLH